MKSAACPLPDGSLCGTCPDCQADAINDNQWPDGGGPVVLPEHPAASPQRFTERGAECRKTHVAGYTGPICSCGAGLCYATRDESENQRFNPASSAATVYCNGFPVTAGRDRGGWFCPHCLTRLSDPPGDHVAVPTDGHTSSAASPSRIALAVKGWRCFLGWHRWTVRNVIGRYISGRGFDGAYEVYQECVRCGEERSYMEWNRRVGAKLEEAIRGLSR